MNAFASSKKDHIDSKYDAALGEGGEDWIRFRGTPAEVLEWLKINDANSVWCAAKQTYMTVPSYIALTSRLPHAS
jgi:hypothetical protein